MSDTELGLRFIKAYSSLITTVWSSETEEAALVADPTAYAVAAGLPVDAGSTVVLDRSPHDGLFSKEEVVGDWTASPGTHILHVPASPLVELDELTDAELDTVGAGDNNFIIIVA